MITVDDVDKGGGGIDGGGGGGSDGAVGNNDGPIGLGVRRKYFPPLLKYR